MIWLAFLWLAVGSIVAVVFGLVARGSQESFFRSSSEIVASQDSATTH